MNGAPYVDRTEHRTPNKTRMSEGINCAVNVVAQIGEEGTGYSRSCVGQLRKQQSTVLHLRMDLPLDRSSLNVI